MQGKYSYHSLKDRSQGKNPGAGGDTFLAPWLAILRPDVKAIGPAANAPGPAMTCKSDRVPFAR